MTVTAYSEPELRDLSGGSDRSGRQLLRKNIWTALLSLPLPDPLFGNRSPKRWALFRKQPRTTAGSRRRRSAKYWIIGRRERAAGDEESLIIRCWAANWLCSHIYMSPAIWPACTWLPLQTMSRRHLQPSWPGPTSCPSLKQNNCSAPRLEASHRGISRMQI